VNSITRRLAAVAFADVAGWSRLVEANDADTLRKWRAVRTELIEPMLQKHHGRLVDLAGDAVLVEFPSAVEAVSWAIDLQRQTTRSDTAPSDSQIQLRIGINVGDLIVDEGRLVGDGVNIAARIHQLVAPGEIVATETVREHVLNKVSVVFRDLGEQQLKNISRPIRIFRLEAEGLPSDRSTRVSGPERVVRTLLALEISEAGDLREDDAREVVSQWRKLQDSIAKDVLPAAGGRLVRRLENGQLIAFPEAHAAVTAAFNIQKACEESARQNLAPQLLPRIGIQMGEVLADGNDLYGRNVGLAPRLAGIAGPGEIVVSASVRDELTPALDADIEDLGECYLKEISEPLRVYRLGPPGPRPVIETSDTADDLRPTIAVIPFAAHGSAQQAIGEILAEEVIAALSRSADLNVISRLSTTAFRGRRATLGEVSTHLKASYVLSGVYRVARRTLYLTVELAEAKSSRVVWANDMKGRVAGIGDGNEGLIDRIVAQASSAIMARELERTQARAPQTLESFTLLIGAIALMHRLSPQDFHRARDMLQAVLNRAPRLAVPRAWLAKWHVLRVWQGWSDDPAVDARLALDCTKRALDADAHCSLALAIDGFVHTNLLKALDVAQARYDLALGVNPNDSVAWLLKGMLHAFKGEGQQATKDTQRALRLSPLDPHRYFYDSLAASAALSAEQYERAIELARRSLRANRTHSSTHRVLAIAQWQLGRHDDARGTVKELLRLEPTLTVTNWLARSPSSEYAIGRLCANALREAGVPN
jgi:adenylate cyclase